MTPRRACRGFSLLEVLVAFTILAMLLAALFQVFSAGLNAARAGDRFTRAAVIAQSRLAAIGMVEPLQEGVSSGSTDDAYHWRVTVGEYLDDQLPLIDAVLQPLTVVVEVYWEEGGNARSVSLTSMLLGPRQP
ncbi:MAG: type II secretion system protein [Gammaproteobacteria bacterium]|jgi:general secretion pathway protein I|nr:type II secretion system protein [Gammaproteobacteria bacterium]MDX2461253.1 type II secretion system protein [Gammaproteobacteria bacterium]